MTSQDIYSGAHRIGRVEPRGRRFLAFVVDEREGALRPIGTFPTARAAREAIVSREARHAA